MKTFTNKNKTVETHNKNNKNKTSQMVWSRNPIAKRNAGKNSVILRDTKIPTSTGKTKNNMD